MFHVSDEIDRGIEKGSSKQCNKEDYDSVQLKLLCGGDLLESFAVPGLWKDEDVRQWELIALVYHKTPKMLDTLKPQPL